MSEPTVIGVAQVEALDILIRGLTQLIHLGDAVHRQGSGICSKNYPSLVHHDHAMGR